MSEANEIIAVEEATDIMPVDTQDKIFGEITDKVKNEGFWASFDTTSMSGKKAMYNVSTASQTLSQYMETPITISHIAFGTTEITPEGKAAPETMLCVFLIDDKGNSFVSASQGIIKSAASLLKVYGDPDTWEEDIVCVVKQTDTRSGNRYKYLAVE